jgi:hypothetical protein
MDQVILAEEWKLKIAFLFDNNITLKFKKTKLNIIRVLDKKNTCACFKSNINLKHKVFLGKNKVFILK